MGRGTLGFYLPRPNWLKHYGPVVDEARRRGWDMLFLVPTSDLAGPKDTAHGLLSWIVEQVPVAVALFDRGPKFANVLRSYGVSTVVSVGFRWPGMLETARRSARERGVRWASLPSIQEELLQILEEGPGILDGWDLPTTATAAGVHALAELIPGGVLSILLQGGMQAARLALARLQPTGYPVLDPVPGLDRLACREKLGLPAGQRLLFFAPAARPHLLRPKWAAWWYRNMPLGLPVGGIWPGADRVPSYRQIARVVRRYADRHGAQIVVKTRKKHRDPPWLRRLADYVIGDLSFHPFTTLEVLKACDAYIGLASALTIEATAIGLPQVHVLAYPGEAHEHPLYWPLRKKFYIESGLWEPLHRVYLLEEWEMFLAFAEAAPWMEPSWSTNIMRRAALDDLVGWPIGSASARFMDALEGIMDG